MDPPILLADLFTCEICLDNIKTYKFQDCDHMACSTCIESMFNNRLYVCHNCRQPIINKPKLELSFSTITPDSDRLIFEDKLNVWFPNGTRRQPIVANRSQVSNIIPTNQPIIDYNPNGNAITQTEIQHIAKKHFECGNGSGRETWNSPEINWRTYNILLTPELLINTIPYNFFPNWNLYPFISGPLIIRDSFEIREQNVFMSHFRRVIICLASNISILNLIMNYESIALSKFPHLRLYTEVNHRQGHVSICAHSLFDISVLANRQGPITLACRGIETHGEYVGLRWFIRAV